MSAFRKMSPPSSDSSSTSSSDSETVSNVDLFRNRANYIRLNRYALALKFPRTIWIPSKNDMEWCSFCLGIHLCREIYGELTTGESALCYRKLPHRRYPLLSIVLHMYKDQKKSVLRFLHQWFLMKGMRNSISMWMYALLACLEKGAVDATFGEFLKTLHKDCKSYILSGKEWHKPRVTLIMDILEDYFRIDRFDSDSDASEKDLDAYDSIQAAALN